MFSSCLRSDRLGKRISREVHEDPVEKQRSAEEVDTSKGVGLNSVEYGRWTVESFTFEASPSLWGSTKSAVESICGEGTLGEHDDITSHLQISVSERGCRKTRRAVDVTSREPRRT
jgi:hypothetical protein